MGVADLRASGAAEAAAPSWTLPPPSSPPLMHPLAHIKYPLAYGLIALTLCSAAFGICWSWSPPPIPRTSCSLPITCARYVMRPQNAMLACPSSSHAGCDGCLPLTHNAMAHARAQSTPDVDSAARCRIFSYTLNAFAA